MSQGQPPPYPGGNEKAGFSPQSGAPPPGQYPPPGQPGYPPPGQQPPPQAYAPPPQGYAPPPQQHGAPPPQSYGQPGAPPPQGYGQPPPGGMQQQYPVVVTQPTTTVVHTGPMMQQFRESPVPCSCPHCHQQVVTAVQYESGTFTWLICGAICLLGLAILFVWLGCCLIPFCIDGCKDVVHSCPNCNQTIHRWNRLS